MNKGFYTFLGFVVGGALGFFGAKKLFEEKYRRIADEEIASVKQVYERRNPRIIDKKVDSATTTNISGKARPISEYTKYDTTVKKLKYDTVEKENSSTKIDHTKPYIITPDDYGDNDDYDMLSLTYYADGTLADDDDVKMSNDEIRQSVGLSALGHFGEYEADTVYVRNEQHKTDYEILLSRVSYSDVLKERPYLKED